MPGLIPVVKIGAVVVGVPVVGEQMVGAVRIEIEVVIGAEGTVGGQQVVAAIEVAVAGAEFDGKTHLGNQVESPWGQ